jgi:hypothetical protein
MVQRTSADGTVRAQYRYRAPLALDLLGLPIQISLQMAALDGDSIQRDRDLLCGTVRALPARKGDCNRDVTYV